MFSISISGVLFSSLIVVLQALTAVSALPTSTTSRSASAELETRQASDSDRNNSNNNHGNGNNSNTPNNTTTSNKVTPAQIAGVVIGALCTIALALIFWYCFVQHRRRKQELRAMQEKATAIENTKRADPSYEYAKATDVRSFA